MTRVPVRSHDTPRDAAGEHPLPGGRTRAIAPFAILATLGLATVLALGLAALRGDAPLELPAGLAAALDGRTDGERAVAFAQSRLAAAPNDPRAKAELAFAYLQRVRETADPAYYVKADALLGDAVPATTSDADVAVAAGTLANAKHDFWLAATWGETAVRLAPSLPAAWGVLTDALIETGRYDEAVAAAQRMVDLRPDLASLTRVSYVRELYGDLDGAIAAMRRATLAGAPRSEGVAWSEVQLGHLLFAKGDLAAADAAYASAQRRIDGYVHALAGAARVRAARGDLQGAARLYETVARRLPIPDLVGALADISLAQGDRARAEGQYAVVDATMALLRASGVRTDIDVALFDADHGRRLGEALAAARAEYAVRPSVHVAQALAWAEYRSGDLALARRFSDEALRLGTQDPLMLYRAGVIAQDTGDDERARSLLRRSAELNPRFSVLFAGDLAARLSRLGAPR